jgi:hypothetical protein
MKLHEEFREYENLWEDYEPDEISKMLWAMDDIEIEYDGWTEEGFNDHFDSRYGHWTTPTSYDVPDTVYKVDAMTMYEALIDHILPKYINEVDDKNLVAEYKSLVAACEESENSSKEASEAAWDALALFIVQNMEDLVALLYDKVQEHFEDDARRYASW